MKLVDIVFVLTAAATANAILISADNNGSPQASSTSSQVSGSTNEPNPGTSDDWQRIMDAIDLSLSDQDWQEIIDPIDSDQDWQNVVDRPSSDTFSQISGPTDKPDSNIPKGWQQSMDQPGPSASKQSRKQSTNEPGLVFPDKYWQRLIDEVDSDTFEEWQKLFDISDPSTSSQDQQHSTDQSNPSTYGQNQQQSMDTIDSSIFDEYWHELFDITDSSTSNQVSDPTNEPNLDISDQDQQQPVDAIGLSISNENWQEIIDAANPTTFNQNQQQSMDVVDPNVSKRGQKRSIDETSSDISSQASDSTNEPSPSTSDEYWKPLFDIINPNILSQDPIDQSSPSTSSQDQQQPMKQGKSANTVSNKIAGLSEKDQITFDGINQRLVESKIIQKKKHKEYWDYEPLD
ncbi:hypothetical protein O5D80_006579 [Batrachochytrium dendrobatidis]|nr:hypothetical protein O5D80_006579 [Batrachochytrium dendrobatidis]